MIGGKFTPRPPQPAAIIPIRLAINSAGDEKIGLGTNRARHAFPRRDCYLCQPLREQAMGKAL